MWALVEYKGFQFHVKEGQDIIVPLVHEIEEKEIEIDRVLVLKKDDRTIVGTPYVKGAKVRAKVLEHVKLPKITVFKYKAKKNCRRKLGHRQKATRIKILQIKS